MEASRAFQADKHDKGYESLVPRSLTGKKGTRKGRGLRARADVHSLADTICSAIDVTECNRKSIILCLTSVKGSVLRLSLLE
ncbi:hypothetical protein Tco_1491310, partial [Tanacetum coccineum]